MKRFGFHSNSRGANEIKDLTISIDFQIKKHGVVTPVWYYNYGFSQFKKIFDTFLLINPFIPLIELKIIQ